MTPTQTPRGRLRLIPIALSVMLLVAACGGDDDEPSGAVDDQTTTTVAEDGGPREGGGACPIDPAALSAVVELEMARIEGERCGFEATSPGAGRLIEVRYTTIDDFVFDGSEGEAVDGVGDGATWDVDMADSLLVKDGNAYFSVQVLAMGTDLPANLRAKALATTVAQLILG